MQNINDIPIIECKTSDITLITPEVSAYFIDAFKYKYNRRMGLKKVRDMRRAMETGAFPITDGYFCTSRDTGKRDMIDLFHRCTVSRDYKLSFRTFIHDLTVETEDLKKALWWSIDGDDRDLADYFAALGAADFGLGVRDLTCLSTACGYLESKFSALFLENHRKVQLIITERLAIAERYLGPAGSYFSAIRRSEPDVKNSLRNGFNIALGSILMESHPELAIPFYKDIARNNGLHPGDPQHGFRKELTSRGAIEKNLLEHAQRQVQYWNSYFDSKTRFVCRGIGKGFVIPIKGTDYSIGG